MPTHHTRKSRLMNILVTGSGGFIGKALFSSLERAGHNVIGLRSSEIEAVHSPSNKVQVADIASRESIEVLSQNIIQCDAIIHAAASLDKDLLASAVPIVNCLGTQNVLWLANRWQCSNFIYISGVSVIGRPIFDPITESHPVQPTSAYLASKLFGEHLVHLASKTGMKTASLRVTAPVGPGMPTKRLLTTAVSHAMRNEAIELSGNGTRQQNYVDVRDIAHATALCLEKNISGLYNIAGEQSVSNYDLASLCIDRCNSSSRIEFNGTTDEEDDCKWIVSCEKAERNFGYAPKYSLRDAIDLAIEDCSKGRFE